MHKLLPYLWWTYSSTTIGSLLIGQKPLCFCLFLLLAAAGALAMANLNGTTSDDETDSGMSGDEEQLRKRIKTCWSSITWLIERSINGWGQSSVRPHRNYLYIASVRNGGEQISKSRRNKESTRFIRKYRRYNDRHSKSISGEHGDQTCSERLLLMQQATVILSSIHKNQERKWSKKLTYLNRFAGTYSPFLWYVFRATLNPFLIQLQESISS